MNNYGNQNELDYLNFFSHQLSDGITDFVFKCEIGYSKIYKNIKRAYKVEKINTRKKGICNKGDIILVDKNNIEYPLSIKMNNTNTAWESADYSLKYLLYEFIQCNGKIEIANNIRVRIDNHNEHMEKYTFGDDILNGGCILIQSIKYANIIKFNNNTVVVNCHRLYYEYEQLIADNKYKPVIVIRKDSGRNKSDPVINGYRIEVIPNYASVDINHIYFD